MKKTIFGILLITMFFFAIFGSLLVKEGNLLYTIIYSSIIFLIPGILLIYFGIRYHKHVRLVTKALVPIEVEKKPSKRLNQREIAELSKHKGSSNDPFEAEMRERGVKLVTDVGLLYTIV